MKKTGSDLPLRDFGRKPESLSKLLRRSSSGASRCFFSQNSLRHHRSEDRSGDVNDRRRCFAERRDAISASFSDPECPSWAKCVAVNSDGTIVFFDTIPQGYDGSAGKWIFPAWKFVRCCCSTRRGTANDRGILLIREG